MCSVIVSASQSVPAAALLQTLGSLEELSLGFCKIEEKDYEFLLRLSNLRKLSMNNIRHFTASTFQYFVHLTSLSFTRSYLPIGALPYVCSCFVNDNQNTADGVFLFNFGKNVSLWTFLS
jgi:hypothetical protein